MFLVPLLLIILVILLFAYLFRGVNTNIPLNQIQNNSGSANSSGKPLEILKERYAKGEISEEEYLRIKRNLE